MAYSDDKKQAMRTASTARREHFKDAGLVQRSVWIRAEDSDAFDVAIAALTDHARIISYLIGYDLGMTPKDILAAIKKHSLPYDIEDMTFLLTRGLLHDDEEKMLAVLAKYGLKIGLDRLRG